MEVHEGLKTTISPKNPALNSDIKILLLVDKQVFRLPEFDKPNSM